MGDLLYAFTEWLRSTQLTEFSLKISETSLSLWIGSNFWVIPIIQTIHILAIAAAFSAVLMTNMRVLGVTGRSWTMPQTANRFLPWIWWSLAVLILSGLGLIIGEPVRELINPIFWIKMGLVIALILISIAFHSYVTRHMGQWDAAPGGHGGIRLGAVLIILLWCTIMVAGRWIAYAPV